MEGFNIVFNVFQICFDILVIVWYSNCNMII